MDDGDDAHGFGRHGVDDAVGRLVDFLQWLFGIFVDGMTAARRSKDGFSAFDDAGDRAVGVEFRVAGEKRRMARNS